MIRPVLLVADERHGLLRPDDPLVVAADLPRFDLKRIDRAGDQLLHLGIDWRSIFGDDGLLPTLIEQRTALVAQQIAELWIHAHPPTSKRDRRHTDSRSIECCEES